MEDIYNLKSYVVITYYVFISFLIIAIVLDNKKPAKSFAYIFLLLLFPIGGVLLYFLLGVHYQKKKLFTRLRNYQGEYIQTSNNRDKKKEGLIKIPGITQKIPTLFYNIDYVQFTVKNDIKFLVNGEEKFPVLIGELKKAKKTIYLEYYIFNDDKIGNKIIEILCEKSLEGVDVKVIYDPVGSSLSKKAVKRLKQHNVEIKSYMPVFFSRFAHKANYRNHRKIIVIDDKTGFLGGMNITDKYINPNNNNLFWRDTHVMIKGEAVFDLQLLFISDWFFVSGKKIEPNQNVDFSSIDCQVPTSILGSDYGTDFQHIMEAFFGMITNAKEEVLISTPYFLPNETILNALIITAKSGVKIKLLLPQKTDLASAYYASQTYLKEVLKNNIEVYYYTKGMMHAKTMIVDNSICTVGSTNMDQRSFDLNAEVNMFIIDEKKSLELKSQFEADLKDSYKLNINELLNWPWYKKALSSLARLIAPIL